MLTQTNWGKITTDIHNPWEKVEVMFFALGHRGLYNLESFSSLYPIEISQSKGYPLFYKCSGLPSHILCCVGKGNCRSKNVSILSNVWVFHDNGYGRSKYKFYLFVFVIRYMYSSISPSPFWSLVSLPFIQAKILKITINIWQTWQILPDCLLWKTTLEFLSIPLYFVLVPILSPSIKE